MNSIIAIELNTLFQEVVKDYPITGKVTLDQKLVMVGIGLITTYFGVLFAKLIKPFWKEYIYHRYFVSDIEYFATKNKNVIRFEISPFTDLYERMTLVIPTLKINKYFDTANDNDEFYIKDNFMKDNLTIKSFQEKKNNKIDLNDEIFVKDTKKKYQVSYIKFENRILTILYYYKKLSGGRKTLILIERQKNETLNEVKAVICNFLNYCKNYDLDENFKYNSIFEIKKSEWHGKMFFDKKNIKTVIGSKPKEILNDIKKFEDKYKPIYDELGIKKKRCYLLYGPPGNGKTSLIHAISSELGRNLYKLDFNESGLGDDEYKNLFSRIGSNSIILLDDVDYKLLTEGGSIDKKRTVVMESSNKEGSTSTYAEDCKISYQTLLNILDGFNSVDDTIMFITTNHPDKIGGALIRPGRIDVMFKMDNPNNEEVIEYFQMFYGLFDLDEQEILTKAKEFNNIRKERPISFASLQQYLIKYMKNIDEAIEHTEDLFIKPDLSACV